MPTTHSHSHCLPPTFGFEVPGVYVVQLLTKQRWSISVPLAPARRCAGGAGPHERVLHGAVVGGQVAAIRGRAGWGSAAAGPCTLLHGCVRPCACFGPCCRGHLGSRAETLVTAIERVCARYALDPANVHRPLFRLWLAGMNNPNYAATVLANPALRHFRYRPQPVASRPIRRR